MRPARAAAFRATGEGVANPDQRCVRLNPILWIAHIAIIQALSLLPHSSILIIPRFLEAAFMF